MMDKIFLLNSWPFLVKHIQLVVDYLKSKSSAVFTDEIARYPNRNRRIQMSSALTSRGFPGQRGCGGKPTRSLLELTADTQVFERLHRAFTWMLKAGGDRLTEKLLEGPVTEGCVVDVNRLEGCIDIPFLLYLWPPYGIGQAIIFLPCGFFLLFCSSPNLSGRRLDCLPYFHTWCGLSANLECRSEMCCTRLAGNAVCKNSPKICRLGNIAQVCWAISSQLRHVSTIGKKLVKQQYLLNMSPQCVKLRPTSRRDRCVSLGHAR